MAEYLNSSPPNRRTKRPPLSNGFDGGGAVASKPNPFEPDYCTKSQVPEMDTAYIKRIAFHPEGELLTAEHAKAEHASLNGYSAQGAQQALKESEARKSRALEEEAEADEQRRRQRSHRLVQTKELNHENAAYPLFQRISLLFSVLIGVPLVSTTFGALVIKSEKFDILFEYPVLSMMFVFVPISLMVLIGHQYGELRYDDEGRGYWRRLWWMITPLTVIWVGTLLPAYSAPSGETSNLLSDTSGDSLVFSVHLTTQVFLEILIGGALKCAVFDVTRSYKKNVSIPGEIYAPTSAHDAEIHQRSEVAGTASSIIRRYIDDNEATLAIHVANCVALYHEFSREHEVREQFVRSTAQLAEAKAILSLSKNAENTVISS